MKKIFAVFIFFIFASPIIFAAGQIGQGRIFLGPTSIAAKEFNDNLDASGLKKLDLVNNFGAEITFPAHPKLNLGMRFAYKIFGDGENPANSATDFDSQGTQSAIALLARGNFMKSDSFMLDAFLGVGGSNTNIKIRTITGTLELDKSAPSDWVASPYAAGGISLSAGAKKIYFTIEAGYEYNKVSDFARTGTTTLTYNDVDLSGSYFTIGLTYDGIPTFTK